MDQIIHTLGNGVEPGPNLIFALLGVNLWIPGWWNVVPIDVDTWLKKFGPISMGPEIN